MTEALSGITILGLKRYCKIGEAAIASICKGVCTALQYLHSKSIVYRSMGRGGVAVTTSGEIKLVLLMACGKLSEPNGQLYPICGARQCVPPEMASEEGYDTKADIWALGITLLEMVSRDHPHFALKDLQDILDYKENGPPKLRRATSRALRDFVSRRLCVDPEQRASATELLEHEFIKKGCSAEDLALLESAGMARREKDMCYQYESHYIGV